MDRFISGNEIQNFLENICEGEEFVVTFQKSNGETATYVCTLPISEERKENVAVVTDEGYKKFNINRVIEIKKVPV